MPPSGQLVTTAEAAAAIGVGRRTLSRWVQQGKVEPTLTTAGGHHRWDVEDLKQQLRNLR
ncbi:helix-turn-helix domain-containing protein [Amycolatopsis pithecellobii]|uniref:Helix-turn-helix domain-containing protein n=1 Tax=Amycolatopsis pithecellobii TaxID=664692 RepID=A0A6N7YW51_9PSEU|nr:helix-turn-helix domain-containing protein [Amycolatopsis pithecellobii]MTD56128.1 helix-turn-helix domain-containing protein [Amycolatopsis pithecellobii]